MYIDRVRKYLAKLQKSTEFKTYIRLVENMIKDELQKDVRVSQNIKNFIRNEEKGTVPQYLDYYLRAIDELPSNSAIRVLSGQQAPSTWRDLLALATKNVALPDDIATHINDSAIAQELSATFQELVMACSDPSKERFRQNLKIIRTRGGTRER